jgi:hypothetical protein
MRQKLILLKIPFKAQTIIHIKRNLPTKISIINLIISKTLIL